MMERWRAIPNSRKNLWEARFWLAFAIPMILFWRESVFVVAIMSLYANYKTADSAYEAAQAKELMEAKEEAT
jgi:hypothetical protein